ncbi:polar growth protein, partial [Mortierella sp. AD031]
MSETVWAIHNFEAEAEDEISFHIDEPIIVLQKDELYQDGWWEGINSRGETGLFPQNYTVKTPPEKAQTTAPQRDPSVYSGGGDNALASNGMAKYGAVGSNSASNNNNHTHNGIDNNSNTNRMMGQQQQQQQNNLNNLNNTINNMHIHQNPTIASPPMGSVRGGFGGASNNGGLSGGVPNSKVLAQTVEDSLNEPQLTGHPSSWSIEQVAYWLRWCGFDSVVGSFVDNEISGAILLELNLNNLKELDINSFGKRFNIMNAITSLKQITRGGDQDSKSLYGVMSNPSSMYGMGPNIPPRMTSAPIIVPSPRASYDPRTEYMRDP